MNIKADLKTIKKVVNELVDFVKPTYGPNGKKVLIVSGDSVLVLDDGVRSARAYELEDKLEAGLLRLIRETSEKTSLRVKDGTTSSLILLQGIINAVDEETKEKKIGLNEVKAKLKLKVVPVKDEVGLVEIAMMAYKNHDMAKLIGKLVFLLGPDAVIKIQESNKLDTTHELKEGMEIDSGYVHNAMKTDDDEAVWENTPVLLTDRKIEFGFELKDLIDKLVKNGHAKLVVFADDFKADAVQSFADNMGGFKVLAVRVPGFGDRKADLFQDLAAVLGVPVFTNSGTFAVAELSKVDKVVASKDTTTIYGANRTGVEKRVTEIKAKMEKEENEFEHFILSTRLARLSSGIAIIKVGGMTSSEMKAVKYKIDNAINSTRLALKSGVIPGGGVTLRDLEPGNHILAEALKNPRKVLEENGGELTEVYDPIDVVYASLESAVSIASLLLSLCGIIIQTND